MRDIQNKTVLGIDLGTQSLKVVFYDYVNKTVVADESASIAMHNNADGTREQEAHWWISALHEALSNVSEEIRLSAQAISVSGQQHGFVPLDVNGEVICSVKLWCDTSTLSQCKTLTDNFGGQQRCLDQLGNAILPGYTVPKILWLKENHPERYEQLDCILLPHDYLNFYLSGIRAMEYGDASGTGMLSITERKWNKRILSILDSDKDLSRCLPKLVEAGQFIGALKADTADILGLPAGTPIATGGGDNMMAAIGTGNVVEGKMTLSLGTSSTLYAYSDKPIIDKIDGEIAAFCSSTNGWLPLICSLNCANANEAISQLLQHDKSDFELFESLMNKSPAGAAGVLTLPFYNGERAPYLPHAKATILGLDEHNTQPENLTRSAIEGAMFILKLGAEKLASLGLHSNEILVTGGGTNSPAWLQTIANIFNLPVSVFNHDQGAAMGAALQALWSLQNSLSTDDINTHQSSLAESHISIADICDEHITPFSRIAAQPDPDTVTLYQPIFENFKRGVQLAKDYYHHAEIHNQQPTSAPTIKKSAIKKTAITN